MVPRINANLKHQIRTSAHCLLTVSFVLWEICSSAKLDNSPKTLACIILSSLFLAGGLLFFNYLKDYCCECDRRPSFLHAKRCNCLPCVLLCLSVGFAGRAKLFSASSDCSSVAGSEPIGFLVLYPILQTICVHELSGLSIFFSWLISLGFSLRVMTSSCAASASIIGMIMTHIVSGTVLILTLLQRGSHRELANEPDLILGNMERGSYSYESGNREKEADEWRFLVANLSHDLKTPLSALISGIDSLRSMTTLPGQSENTPLAPINSSHENAPSAEVDAHSLNDIVDGMSCTCFFMTMMINRTIDYTKAAHGIDLLPTFQVISVQDSLTMCRKYVQTLQSRIEVRFESLSKDINGSVCTDNQWLQESLTSLVVNAIKYSPQGRVDVKCSWMEHPETSSPLLKISVEDTGIGLTQEEALQIFGKDPLRRDVHTSGGGAGLGLYILAKRMDCLGGFCGYATREDGCQGSVFWFAIPCQPEDEKTSLSPRLTRKPSQLHNVLLAEKTTSIVQNVSVNSMLISSKQALLPPVDMASLSTQQQSHAHDSTAFASFPNTPTSRSGEKLHILVVDDSLSILKFTRKMLERAGHITAEAIHGQSALDSWSTGTMPFDVILMDIQMPVMDGIEATRRIRQCEQKLLSYSGGLSADEVDNSDETFRSQNASTLVDGGSARNRLLSLGLTVETEDTRNENSGIQLKSQSSTPATTSSWFLSHLPLHSIPPAHAFSSNLSHKKVCPTTENSEFHSGITSMDYSLELGVEEDSSVKPSFYSSKMENSTTDQTLPNNRHNTRSTKYQFRPPFHRQSAEALPVLIIGCSANSDAHTQAEAFEAGMDAFLSKPVTHQQLSDTLQRLLIARRLMVEDK